MQIARTCENAKCEDTLSDDKALAPCCFRCGEPTPYSTKLISRIKEELSQFEDLHNLDAKLYTWFDKAAPETIELLNFAENQKNELMRRRLWKLRQMHYSSDPALSLSVSEWHILHPSIKIKDGLGYGYCNVYLGTALHADYTHKWCDREEQVVCSDHMTWLLVAELLLVHYGLLRPMAVCCLNYVVPGYEVLTL